MLGIHKLTDLSALVFEDSSRPDRVQGVMRLSRNAMPRCAVQCRMNKGDDAANAKIDVKRK